MGMQPPPSRTVVETDRHMNDTTMPPPRYSSKKSTRKPAVNVRGRFGLHDWTRLLAASKDLAQRKGAPLRRDIPAGEVRQHKRNHDAWIILRGKVYNIGPYLPYHPGGVDICKGILGKDATVLFDKYHRWVNIDGLIGPLLLGTVALDSPPKDNHFTIVPSKESGLANPPRVSTNTISKASLLSPPDNEEEQILPL